MQRNDPFRILLLPALLAAAGVTSAHAAAPAKRAHPAAPAPAPAPAKETVAYENLHGYLGDRITVHTIYKTTRTGTLARFSQSELTLTIDTAGGSTELSIPKNTIVDIVAAPPAPQH